MTKAELQLFYREYNKNYKIQLLEENGYDFTELEKQIILDEDFILTPYLDTKNVETVGAGHTKDVIMNKNYTIDECMKFLDEDIEIAKNDCLKLFPLFNDYSTFRQEVLINMAFNLGYPRLSKFKSFIGYCNNSNWSHAAIEMLDSKWHKKDVGKRAVALAHKLVGGDY